MDDTDKVISWLEGLTHEDWRQFHSDSEVMEIAKTAIEQLYIQKKEIERIKHLSNEMVKAVL